MTPTGIRFSLLCSILLTSLSCSSVTGPALDPIVQAESNKIALQLERSGALVEDAALTAYVATVGERVVAKATRAPVESFQFAILDAPEPNAFSIPSGHVYISRGLLALLQTEDELAGVLGHEVGHVLERHSLERAAGSVAFAPVRLVTRIGGGLVGLALPRVGAAVTASAEVPAALAGASYGRNQENEADEVGQKLAAAAGWDAAALSRVMDALSSQRELRGEDPNRISWFATHPATPDRAARIRERAAGLETGAPNPVAADQAAFFTRLDGMVVGQSAREGVFDGSDFLHPGLGVAVRLPDGPSWMLVNTAHAVAALREQPPAAVIVELVAQAEDALSVAQAFEPENGSLDAPPEPEIVNGLDTAHATGRDPGGWGRDPIRGSARWIAHHGLVYRILCESSDEGYARFAEEFDAAERSFRLLTPADRERIFEDRLRIVPANAGETLQALVGRTDSVWDVTQAAAANGVETSTVFGAGDLVKITRREPYSLTR